MGVFASVSPLAIRETAETYHSFRSSHLTSHQMIDFVHCPLRYYQKKAGLVNEPESLALGFGSAAHTLILEGQEAFDQRYIVGGPINEKTGLPYGRDTQKFAAWVAEVGAGRTGISDEDYVKLLAMAQMVRGHKEASRLLSSGEPELVLRGLWRDRKAQIRMDYIGDHGLVDLKTCWNLDEFEADAEKYHYKLQMAFYYEILSSLTDQYPKVHLVAVEKQAPYRVGVWEIDVNDICQGINTLRQAASLLNKCEAENSWPTGYETIKVLL